LPWQEPVGYAALVAAAVIATRFLWVFTVPYVIRALDRRPQQRLRRTTAQSRVVVAWSGMRGAVSLAAALALPLETDAGAPLPDRDLVLFITFAVILVTVVGQGLTLPALIRWLRVGDDGDGEGAEELRARLTTTKAAIDSLDQLEAEDWTRNDTIERVRALYEFRKRRFAAQAGKIEDDGIEDRSLTYQRMMHVIFSAQRQALIGLRNQGDISSEVMRRIERELDLEESRLEV
jgi:monovalent cation/hydrogen antiporter